MEKFTPQPKLFVLKFNEYLKNINKKPISEGQILQYKEDNQKEFVRIQAVLANDRVSRQMKEFVVAGLAEELNQGEVGQIDPYNDDFYYSNLQNGARIETVPVYNDAMEITNHRYMKTPAQPDSTQQRQANEINIKYEKEYNNSFRSEQAAKDRFFAEKVSGGEMTFIGEMKFDDYIELRKGSPAGVSGKNFELIPCFDGDNGQWNENRKVYAYNSKEVVTQ